MPRARPACSSGSSDPSSRRQQVVSLTDQGRETAEAIHRQCDASYTRLFDFIPVEKRGMVVESVALLAAGHAVEAPAAARRPAARMTREEGMTEERT